MRKEQPQSARESSWRLSKPCKAWRKTDSQDVSAFFASYDPRVCGLGLVKHVKNWAGYRGGRASNAAWADAGGTLRGTSHSALTLWS
eukprot:scaffold463_cov242-Pinguiococcus_pyrenoidosus.AAC.10